MEIMLNAKIIKNFISKEDSKYIIDASIRSNLWQNAGSKFWDGRAITYKNLKEFDEKAGSIMLDANNRCKDVIEKEYGLQKKIFPDFLQVIRWFPGMEQYPHADDMTNTDINGFQHRKFGSIIYLNDDYSGGRTYYPKFNFEIVPQVGMLAVHPGDPEHLHGVTKIYGAMRYTIASFWAYEREAPVGWSIY